MIDCSFLDSFLAEDCLDFFGVFIACANLSHAGLLRGLEQLADGWSISALVSLGDMVVMCCVSVHESCVGLSYNIRL